MVLVIQWILNQITSFKYQNNYCIMLWLPQLHYEINIEFNWNKEDYILWFYIMKILNATNCGWGKEVIPKAANLFLTWLNKIYSHALAGVPKLVGVSLMDWKAMGLIPGQGTYPGCGLNPRLGHVWEGNQSMFLSHIDISLSFSPALPPSLTKKAWEKNVLGWGLKKILFTEFILNCYGSFIKTNLWSFELFCWPTCLCLKF